MRNRDDDTKGMGFFRKSWISRWSFSSALFLGGILSGAVLTESVIASQSHLQAGLQNLYAAKKELNAATPDKAGHRANAINLVNQAISETKNGIVAGDR